MSNEEQFKITESGEYRTRGGERAIVREVHATPISNDWEYCADGAASGIEWMWYRNGRLFRDETSEFDIVGPWVEEKKEEPPPMEVPPGLVVNEKASFSEAPKTPSEQFDMAFGRFLAELNTIYGGRVGNLVVSAVVDAGEKENFILMHRGSFSSAIGAVEWTKRKLIEELEQAWR